LRLIFQFDFRWISGSLPIDKAGLDGFARDLSIAGSAVRGYPSAAIWMPASVSIGHAASKHQQKHQDDDHNGPAHDNCASEKVSGVHDILTFKSRRGGRLAIEPLPSALLV
jgi:hypothetical protein